MERYPICPACKYNFVDTRSPQMIVCTRPDCGLIAMKDRRTTQVYDQKYVADRYDKYATTQLMSELRMTLVEAVLLLHESLPKASQTLSKGPLLDVGYGNGSFIREACQRGWKPSGNDVNPTQYPGVRQVPLPLDCTNRKLAYRVITFWDCLEHFEELENIRTISNATDWIFLSFPKAPDNYMFCPEMWKHHRPGEHHFHFTPQSLELIFSNERTKATVVYTGNPEDCIRGKARDGDTNILTVALRCEDRR